MTSRVVARQSCKQRRVDTPGGAYVSHRSPLSSLRFFIITLLPGLRPFLLPRKSLLFHQFACDRFILLSYHCFLILDPILSTQWLNRRDWRKISSPICKFLDGELV